METSRISFVNIVLTESNITFVVNERKNGSKDKLRGGDKWL